MLLYQLIKSCGTELPWSSPAPSTKPAAWPLGCTSHGLATPRVINAWHDGAGGADFLNATPGCWHLFSWFVPVQYWFLNILTILNMILVHRPCKKFSVYSKDNEMHLKETT